MPRLKADAEDLGNPAAGRAGKASKALIGSFNQIDWFPKIPSLFFIQSEQSIPRIKTKFKYSAFFHPIRAVESSPSLNALFAFRSWVWPFRLCRARRISARRHSPQRSHQRDLVVGNNSFLGSLFKIIQVHSYSTESTRSDPDRPWAKVWILKSAILIKCLRLLWLWFYTGLPTTLCLCSTDDC